MAVSRLRSRISRRRRRPWQLLRHLGVRRSPSSVTRVGRGSPRRCRGWWRCARSSSEVEPVPGDGPSGRGRGRSAQFEGLAVAAEGPLVHAQLTASALLPMVTLPLDGAMVSFWPPWSIASSGSAVGRTEITAEAYPPLPCRPEAGPEDLRPAPQQARRWAWRSRSRAAARWQDQVGDAVFDLEGGARLALVAGAG